MVIATQNPIEQAGTYRLPEAQLDRFLMKTSLGYPDHEATVAVLADAKTRDRTKAPSAGGHVQRRLRHGRARRRGPRRPGDPGLRLAPRRGVAPAPVSVKLGLSVRGCLAFVRCAKTWAASQGRTHVIPDDIKMLANPVLCHRLLLTAEAQFSSVTVDQVINQILAEVAPPAERVA